MDHVNIAICGEVFPICIEDAKEISRQLNSQLMLLSLRGAVDAPSMAEYIGTGRSGDIESKPWVPKAERDKIAEVAARQREMEKLIKLAKEKSI